MHATVRLIGGYVGLIELIFSHPEGKGALECESSGPVGAGF